MAQLTQQEEQHIRDAFEEAENEVGLAPDITISGTKEAFCESWPTVKEVLAFLKDFAPPGISHAIGIVIKAGDKIFGRICPA